MKISYVYMTVMLLLVCFSAQADDEVIDFVEVYQEKATTENKNNVKVTYLSEKLSENSYLASGFIANHEGVFSIAKFGGEVEKGGRCGWFPQITTATQVENENTQINSKWMFHVAVDQKSAFDVPEKSSAEQLIFIPADLNIEALDKEFRLFLFRSYKQKSTTEENTINVSDGVSFGIADLQDTDMNIAEYGVRSLAVDLERYKFDYEEFLLFKLYFEDEQRDQYVQVASFLYQKTPLGINLVSKSTDFLNWFWVRTQNFEPGKYDAFPWFQGILRYHGAFYVLTQGYGYESVSVSLQKFEYNRLIDVRTYSDGC